MAPAGGPSPPCLAFWNTWPLSLTFVPVALTWQSCCQAPGEAPSRPLTPPYVRTGHPTPLPPHRPPQPLPVLPTGDRTWIPKTDSQNLFGKTHILICSLGLPTDYVSVPKSVRTETARSLPFPHTGTGGQPRALPSLCRSPQGSPVGSSGPGGPAPVTECHAPSWSECLGPKRSHGLTTHRNPGSDLLVVPGRWRPAHTGIRTPPMPPSQHPAPRATNPRRAGTPTEGQMGYSVFIKLTNQVAHKTQDTSCSLKAEPTGSGVCSQSGFWGPFLEVWSHAL